jgi:ribose 5-phosphate isomerase B
MAEKTRAHNDANVLALGARVVDTPLALDIVKTFLHTEFSGDERHSRRVDMLKYLDSQLF